MRCVGSMSKSTPTCIAACISSASGRPRPTRRRARRWRGLINAGASREIIFTRNATEAINLVAASYGRKFLEAGDEIIISELEHHSNIVPWQMLRDEKDLVLKVVRRSATTAS